MTEENGEPTEGREPESPPADPSAPEETPGERAPDDTGAERKPGAPGRVAGWILLVLLAGLSAVEGAGILLRDRLEGRRPVTAAPVALEGPSAPEPPRPATRFGPGTTEVKVIGPGGPAAEAPAPPPTPPEAPGPPEALPQAPPPTVPSVRSGDAAEGKGAAAAGPAEPEKSPPGPARPEAAPRKETREPAGPAFALQAGVFRSQRYRIATERQLGSLGLPHYVTRSERRGRAFRVVVSGEDQDTAARVWEEAGYRFDRTPEGLVAYFYLEDEAARAVKRLARAGIRASRSPYEGPIPVWTVFAGPFPEERARKLKEELAARGLKTYLRRIR